MSSIFALKVEQPACEMNLTICLFKKVSAHEVEYYTTRKESFGKEQML